MPATSRTTTPALTFIPPKRGAAILALIAASAAGCVPAPWREDYRQLRQEVDRAGAPPVHGAGAPEVEVAPPPAIDPAGPLDLDLLVRETRHRNPVLRASIERVRAALEEVSRAGSYDEPSFKFEAWAVPLRRPVAFDRDDANMFGLLQNIPFPGKLGLRSQAALREAEAEFQSYRQEELEVISRLKKAYYAYFSWWKELDFHQEHIRILEEFEKITLGKFTQGSVSQEDVLKAQVELITLHNDAIQIEQQLSSQRAVLNSIINRPIDAPLGRPADPAGGALEVPGISLQAFEEKALEARPELLAARLRWNAALNELELARRDAWLPDFQVGVDYWQMPRRDDAWGGVVGFNLPWLSGKRFAEARRREHAARAGEIGIEEARNRVLVEVHDAWLRFESTRKSLLLVQGELLPKSRQSVEVSRSNYEKDKTSFLNLLEAERSLRDVKIKLHQAQAAHLSALADLERAAGGAMARETGNAK